MDTGFGDTTDTFVTILAPNFFTNTSGQTYFSQTNTTGTPTTSAIQTHGWVDRRGQ